ncbi:MAG TPA: choice-of-anchor L domain-containing protein [Thermoanaerobaculia bacterium]|nr:choice-of-anchor L domain-containing protein [Thermoanaerobaculia bacterium]
MSRRSWACVFALLLTALPAFSITTKSANEGLTATQIASLLTGAGATITNVKITGSNVAIGSFAEGTPALGVTSGVILSTGDIADAKGPNDSAGSGAGLGTEGHPALDAIVDPFETFDAVVLEFDVTTVSPTFAIRYVFASEEYREFVGSEFNDVFAFFVDGANVALTPGSADPVTINTINHLLNNGLYRDNEAGAETEFDGYTAPLLAVAVVEPNVPHHIRIAIADTSDPVLDSAVFIAQGGISGNQIAPIIIPPVSSIEAKSGEATSLDLPLYYAFPSAPPQLTATGLPGATITFTPMFLVNGQFYTTMNIVLGPDTPAGSHVVTIESRIGDAVSYSTIVVVVECKPPVILGTGQPQMQLVTRGTAATLRVTAQGSGPTAYQWYRGFPGMTRNPVAGATGATLNTGPVNEFGSYWVRVTNACGSYDSLAALVIPQ